DNADEFGVELGFQDSTLFDRSVDVVDEMMNSTLTPGFNFNNQPLGNANVSPDQIGSQGLSNFSLGRTNADLGFGGFVFSASSANVSILLRALSAKRTIQIRSRPQIRTLDNQVAQVQVGQNVPVLNGVSTTGLQVTPQ